METATVVQGRPHWAPGTPAARSISTSATPGWTGARVAEELPERLLSRLEALEARLKTGPYMRPFRFHGEPTSLLAVRVMMLGSIIPWLLASIYISIVCDPYSEE